MKNNDNIKISGDTTKKSLKLGRIVNSEYIYPKFIIYKRYIFFIIILLYIIN